MTRKTIRKALKLTPDILKLLKIYSISFSQFLKFTLDFLADLRNINLSILDKEQRNHRHILREF